MIAALGDGRRSVSASSAVWSKASERMLTQTLQQPEGGHMVRYHSFNTVPLRVEYYPTDLGKAAHLRLYAPRNQFAGNSGGKKRQFASV